MTLSKFTNVVTPVKGVLLVGPVVVIRMIGNNFGGETGKRVGLN